MLKRSSAVLLAAAALLLAGCSFGNADDGPIDVAVNASEPLYSLAPVDALPSETPVPEISAAPSEQTQEPSAVPTAEPTPEPTPEPTAEPAPEPSEEAEPSPIGVFKSRANKVNIRSAPNTSSDIVGSVGFEDEVEVLGVEGKFFRINYQGSTCYCYRSYFVPREERLYGYMPAWSEYNIDKDGNIVYEEDGVTPVILTSELIDIRLLIPDIEIYQILGTTENFTGMQLYYRPVPVLQLPCALKLAAAAERFAEDGYTIKIYDCYRPKSVQYIMYDIVGDSRYIANPYNSASNHNRAAAVDMTLIGPDGVELSFPTPMHTFGKIVHRSSSYMWTDEQSANVDYMTDVMVNCGFKTITTEWWHFSDTDYPGYVVMDIDMRDIPMYTANEIRALAHLERYGVEPVPIPLKQAALARIYAQARAGADGRQVL